MKFLLFIALTLFSTISLAETYKIDIEIGSDDLAQISNKGQVVIIAKPVSGEIPVVWQTFNPSKNTTTIDWSSDYTVYANNKTEKLDTKFDYIFENGVFRKIESKENQDIELINNTNQALNFEIQNAGKPLFQVNELASHQKIEFNNHPQFYIGIAKNLNKGEKLTADQVKLFHESIDFSKSHKFKIEVIKGEVFVHVIK